jgi:type VI protein secretion system component VasF
MMYNFTTVLDENIMILTVEKKTWQIMLVDLYQDDFGGDRYC